MKIRALTGNLYILRKAFLVTLVAISGPSDKRLKSMHGHRMDCNNIHYKPLRTELKWVLQHKLKIERCPI